MDWLPVINRVIQAIPIEKILFPARDPQKELKKFADEVQAVEVQKPPTAAPETAPAAPERKESSAETSQEDIATACVPCALGHFSRSAGSLEEAMRFKNEGITSNEIIDRVADVLKEQNALERYDLTPEKIASSPQWEREIAEEALDESRRLRHRLESLSSIDQVEQAAVAAASYYRKLNRQWFKGRFAHLGEAQAAAIAGQIAKESDG